MRLTILERNAVCSHRTRNVEVIPDLYSFWKIDFATLDPVMQLSEQLQLHILAEGRREAVLLGGQKGIKSHYKTQAEKVKNVSSDP